MAGLRGPPHSNIFPHEAEEAQTQQHHENYNPLGSDPVTVRRRARLLRLSDRQNRFVGGEPREPCRYHNELKQAGRWGPAPMMGSPKLLKTRPSVIFRQQDDCRMIAGCQYLRTHFQYHGNHPYCI